MGRSIELRLLRASSGEQETQQSADIRVTDGSLCATKYQGKLATSLQPNRRHA